MRAFLVVFALAVPVIAQDPPLSPKRAWKEIETIEWKARAARVLEFLKRWDASGQKASGEELYYLAEMYNAVRREADARASYRSVTFDDSVDLRVRAEAGIHFLSSASFAARGMNDAAAVQTMLDMNRALSTFRRLGLREHAASALIFLAGFYGRRGLVESSIQTWIQAGRERPRAVTLALEEILKMRLHEPQGFAASKLARDRCLEEFTELIQIFERHVAHQRKTGDKRLGRSIYELAKSRTQRRRIEVFARPAPEWTLEHAFGEVRALKQLRGKAVLLYFWTTQRESEFSAIRKLLREYQLRPFTVVGVTVTRPRVRDSNYGWDADMANKAGKQYKPKWLVREQGVAAGIVYRAREIEFIRAFLKNHEISWPNVMIDAEEPASKYGFTQWPLMVFLDKRGRVRGTRHQPIFGKWRDKREQERVRRLIEQLVTERG